MKKYIISIILTVLCFAIIAEPVTDELWLKAVQFRTNAKNTYPSQTINESIMKNKAGEVQSSSVITIGFKAEEKNIIAELIEATRDSVEIASDDAMVASYLAADVLDDGEGMFYTETSDDISIERKDSEMIEGENFVKFWIEYEKDEDGEKLDIEGYIWINEKSGVPLKSELELDPHKMMVKSIVLKNQYKLIDDEFLVTDKITTDIVISIVFKKMYMSQIATMSGFKSLN